MRIDRGEISSLRFLGDLCGLLIWCRVLGSNNTSLERLPENGLPNFLNVCSRAGNQQLPDSGRLWRQPGSKKHTGGPVQGINTLFGQNTTGVPPQRPQRFRQQQDGPPRPTSAPMAHHQVVPRHSNNKFRAATCMEPWRRCSKFRPACRHGPGQTRYSNSSWASVERTASRGGRPGPEGIPRAEARRSPGEERRA